MRRVIIDILLIGLVLTLPSWVAFLAAAIFFFEFPHFYELIAVGFVLDLLYGVPLPRFFEFQFVLSLAALLLFILLWQVKRRMRI